MAFRRLSMRKIHTTLRLFFEAGLSIRAVARTLRVSPEVPAKAGMGEYLRRAQVAGPSWPLPEGMDRALSLPGCRARPGETPPARSGNFPRRRPQSVTGFPSRSPPSAHCCIPPCREPRVAFTAIASAPSPGKLPNEPRTVVLAPPA